MRTKAQILLEIRQLKQNPASYNETVVRADPYSLVAQKMLEKLPHSKVFDNMSFKEVRAYCKKPVMTTMYNSIAQPIKAFGEDTEELHAFYETLQELFPGAMNVLQALNDRWDKEATYHSWKLPDGHTSHVKVVETIDGILDNEGLNLPYRFKRNQPSTTGTSLAPNFIHSFDGFAVRYIIENADFQVAHIHDEIQAHPNNMGRVRELYLEAFKVIASHPYLEEFCEEDFNIDTRDFIAGLKDSSYALC